MICCPRCRSLMIQRLLYRYICQECNYQGERDDFDTYIDTDGHP